MLDANSTIVFTFIYNPKPIAAQAISANPAANPTKTVDGSQQIGNNWLSSIQTTT